MTAKRQSLRRRCAPCMQNQPTTPSGKFRRHRLAGGSYGEVCPNSGQPAPTPTRWLAALLEPVDRKGSAA